MIGKFGRRGPAEEQDHRPLDHDPQVDDIRRRQRTIGELFALRDAGAISAEECQRERIRLLRESGML